MTATIPLTTTDIGVLDALDFEADEQCEVWADESETTRCPNRARWLCVCTACTTSILYCDEDKTNVAAAIARGYVMLCRRCGKYTRDIKFVPIGTRP